MARRRDTFQLSRLVPPTAHAKLTAAVAVRFPKLVASVVPADPPPLVPFKLSKPWGQYFTSAEWNDLAFYVNGAADVFDPPVGEHAVAFYD